MPKNTFTTTFEAKEEVPPPPLGLSSIAVFIGGINLTPAVAGYINIRNHAKEYWT